MVVFSPSGIPIECATAEEAQRVRAWAAWVLAGQESRVRTARQRALEAANAARSKPAPQDWLRYRRRA
jgi:hypothetical protein